MQSIDQKVGQSVQKALKKASERKYSQTSISGGVDYSGTVALVSGITQGVTDTTRVGDSVRFRRLIVRGTVALGDATNAFRLIFFRWKAVTAPTAATIYESVGTVLAPYQRLPSWDYKDQFVLLWDSLMTTDTYNPIVSFKLDLPLEFNGQFIAGSATSGFNLIYYAAISDSSAVPNPGLNMMAEVQFTDS